MKTLSEILEDVIYPLQGLGYEVTAINLGSSKRRKLTQEILASAPFTHTSIGLIVPTFMSIPIKLVQGDPDHMTLSIVVAEAEAA
jgi:hypothetical protein